MTENERLTFETELGISIDKNEDCPTMSICWNCDIPPRKCNYFKDAIDKLAKYETIGTIEEFKALKEKNEQIPIIHGKAELELHDKGIRNKVIDEFAEKFIFKAVCEGCSGCCNCHEEGRQSECEDWKAYMEIAEEMKK